MAWSIINPDVANVGPKLDVVLHMFTSLNWEDIPGRWRNPPSDDAEAGRGSQRWSLPGTSLVKVALSETWSCDEV